MLFSSNDKKLTSPQINKYLHCILGKNISSNLLRYIFLTDKYGKVQEEIKQDASEMSHSLETQALFKKSLQKTQSKELVNCH